MLAMSKGEEDRIIVYGYWAYNIIVFLCCWRIWRDGVSFNTLLLQASLLLGVTLVSWMLLEKLHDVKKEQHFVGNIIKAEEMHLQERKLHMEDHCKVIQGKVADLMAKSKKLEMDCQMKANRAQVAGAIVSELKKQLEEFRLKYDCLLDYNQTLRNQLQLISHEAQKIDESDGWSNRNSKLGCPALEMNEGSVDFENVMETTTKCSEYLLSGTHSSSSPRHRRPIYQC